MTTASPPPLIVVVVVVAAVAAVGGGIVDGGVVDQAVAKDTMDGEAEASFVIDILIIAPTPPKIIAPPFEQSVDGGVVDGGVVDQEGRGGIFRRRHHNHRADAADNHRAPVRAIDSIVALRAIIVALRAIIIIPALPTDRWRPNKGGGDFKNKAKN